MNKLFIVLLCCCAFMVASCIVKNYNYKEVDCCMPTDSASLGIPKKITFEDIKNDTLGLYSHEGLIEKDMQ